jgi:hypothetical protein
MPALSPRPARVPMASEVVRNKYDRSHLTAHMCRQCQGFFDACGMKPSDESVRRCMQECGRHRTRAPEQPGTPASFWDIGFDSTQGTGGAPSPGARSTRSLMDTSPAPK